MTELVESLELGVTWDPNAPDAILLTADSGPSALALHANPNDPDERCVVLVWTGCRYACMTPPNDEAISGIGCERRVYKVHSGWGSSMTAN